MRIYEKYLNDIRVRILLLRQSSLCSDDIIWNVMFKKIKKIIVMYRKELSNYAGPFGKTL